MTREAIVSTTGQALRRRWRAMVACAVDQLACAVDQRLSGARRGPTDHGTGCPGSVPPAPEYGEPSSGPRQMKWCRMPLLVVWTA